MVMEQLPLPKAIQNDVDRFCVSNIDEAIELRQAGLNKKILILGVSELEAVDLAKDHDITHDSGWTGMDSSALS